MTETKTSSPRGSFCVLHARCECSRSVTPEQSAHLNGITSDAVLFLARRNSEKAIYVSSIPINEYDWTTWFRETAPWFLNYDLFFAEKDIHHEKSGPEALALMSTSVGDDRKVSKGLKLCNYDCLLNVSLNELDPKIITHRRGKHGRLVEKVSKVESIFASRKNF